MRLLPPNATVTSGRILFDGLDLLTKTPAEMRDIRGKQISLIQQEPMTSLNPVLTIGLQIIEVIRCHERISRKAARARAIELLDLVSIPDRAAPDRRPSAQSLGRHAPAGHDRHGRRLSSETADRRRTHDRARCHDPGAGARPARRPAPSPRDGGAADHPRSRRGGAMGRPHRRDVRRPDRREGRHRALLRRSRCTPIRAGCWARGSMSTPRNIISPTASPKFRAASVRRRRKLAAPSRRAARSSCPPAASRRRLWSFKASVLWRVRGFRDGDNGRVAFPLPASPV